MLFRLFPTNPDDLEFIQEVRDSENLEENPLSLEDELEEAIQHSAKKQRHNSNNEFKAVSNEILNFCSMHWRPSLQQVSEGAYSAAGLLVTKIRFRMSDYLLDTLCFLRAHFL